MATIIVKVNIILINFQIQYLSHKRMQNKYYNLIKTKNIIKILKESQKISK